MRLLELFAGIGGVAAAIASDERLKMEVALAVDIDQQARAVYQTNFLWPYRTAEIASLSQEELVRTIADIWWLSPPCLPFTFRGHRKDLSDPRNGALLHLINVIADVRPSFVILENVPGFETSETIQLLKQKLITRDYRFEVRDICPTEFGWCNRRRRIYVLAWQRGVYDQDVLLNSNDNSIANCPSLRSMIDLDINLGSHPTLFLGAEIAAKYEMALDRITEDEMMYGKKPSACFASSYGKTLLHAGSYYVTQKGIRRFSPWEVQQQLGFSRDFRFPEGTSNRTAWRMLGDSLAIPVVRQLLFDVQNAYNDRAS